MSFLDSDGGVEYPFSRDLVFDAVQAAVPLVPGLKIESVDKVGSRILVKAGISVWSFGENVSLAVTETAPGKSRVSITSSSKGGALAGAFDMGKNHKNIERLLTAISASLRNAPQTPAQGPAAAHDAGADPAARLAKLKDLADKGLITPEDFDKRKAEILAQM